MIRHVCQLRNAIFRYYHVDPKIDILYVQWNLRITATLGELNCGRYTEVALIERLTILHAQNSNLTQDMYYI